MLKTESTLLLVLRERYWYTDCKYENFTLFRNRKEDTQDEFNVNAYTCIKFLWQTFHSLSLSLCNQELSFFVEIVYSNSLSLTSKWVKYTFRSRWFIHFVHCTQGSNEVFTVLCCFESSCAWTWFLSCVSCIFLNMLYIYFFGKVQSTIFFSYISWFIYR